MLLRLIRLAPALALTACGAQVLDLDLGSSPPPRVLERAPGPDALVRLPDRHTDFAPPPRSVHSQEPPAPTQRARVVWLATDGLTLHSGPWGPDNAQTDTSFLVLVDDAEIPAFDHTPWGEDRAAVLAQLLEHLHARFVDFAVHFTNERPASGDYTTVVVGGASELLGQPAGVGGIAPLDANDFNPNDIAFVFSPGAAEHGYDLSGLSAFVAHELAHSLGLQHIDRDEDVMAPAACHCDITWGEGAVVDADLEPTDARQDDLAALAAVLLPRDETPPLCPFHDEPEPEEADAALPLEDGVGLNTVYCADDTDDRWVLDAPVGCEVEATVDLVHAEGNLSLRMLRPDGTTGGRSFSRTDHERAVEMVTDDGPPRARVYGLGSVENAYTITMRPHCPEDLDCEAGDLHEPNDARGSAATRLYPPAAALGAICEGDADYYRAYVKMGCTVTVDVAFTDADGDLDLKLERYSGEALDRSLSVSDDEQVEWTADRNTLVYAKVYGFRGALNTYRLDVATTCPEPTASP
jgi:hypothetical protein